jgi:hypothetical protein
MSFDLSNFQTSSAFHLGHTANKKTHYVTYLGFNLKGIDFKFELLNSKKKIKRNCNKTAYKDVERQ